MLRRDLRTPLYHPFYVNYGFNKVSFVESLRFESGEIGRKRGIMRRLSVPFDCDGLRVRLSASDVGSREGDEAKDRRLCARLRRIWRRSGVRS